MQIFFVSVTVASECSWAEECFYCATLNHSQRFYLGDWKEILMDDSQQLDANTLFNLASKKLVIRCSISGVPNGEKSWDQAKRVWPHSKVNVLIDMLSGGHDGRKPHLLEMMYKTHGPLKNPHVSFGIAYGAKNCDSMLKHVLERWLQDDDRGGWDCTVPQLVQVRSQGTFTRCFSFPITHPFTLVHYAAMATRVHVEMERENDFNRKILQTAHERFEGLIAECLNTHRKTTGALI